MRNSLEAGDVVVWQVSKVPPLKLRPACRTRPTRAAATRSPAPATGWRTGRPAALRRRGDLTIWVTPEAIAGWTPARSGRRGRPSRYSDLAIEAGLMLRLAFGRPWRQTEGLLGSLMRLLGLDAGSGSHDLLPPQRRS